METVAGGEDRLEQALAVCGRQLLRIVEPFGDIRFVENNGGGNDGTGERAPSGLIRAGDGEEAAPGRQPLELEIGAGRHVGEKTRRIGWRARFHAAEIARAPDLLQVPGIDSRQGKRPSGRQPGTYLPAQGGGPHRKRQGTANRPPRRTGEGQARLEMECVQTRPQGRIRLCQSSDS